MVLLQVRQSPVVPVVDGSGRRGGRRIGGRCERAMCAAVGERPTAGGGGDNEPLMRLLRKLWAQTDALFEVTIGADSLLERPIALRNPFLFYMGHLPAFDWNTLRPFIRHAPFNANYDYIFSRGIDPDVEDPSVCHDHPPPPPVWPPMPAIAAYRDDVRSRISSAAASLPRAALALAVEHDAMHVETLLYMAAQKRCRQGRRSPHPPALYTLSAAVEAAAAASGSRPVGGTVHVPAGWARLGRSRPADLEPSRNFKAHPGDPVGDFGWDNEFPAVADKVRAFAIGALPVTVGAFASFMAAGGYATRQWWGDEDWRWVQRAAVTAPASWAAVDQAGEVVGGSDGRHPLGWAVRTVDEVLVPLGAAANWPVAVSLAEARAYAAWCGGRLPTEAEWQRAAFGELAADSGAGATVPTGGAPALAARAPLAAGTERLYPWGDDAPVPGVHGNFGSVRRHPSDVGTHPAGSSALGVRDLIGDGWEWTSTVFAPFEGFQAHPAYPTYSSDFFDGKHYVLKGASWATDAMLIRASFRNFYQARYPYVFSKFRVVYDVPSS